MLRANALLGVEGRKGAAWDVEAGYEDFEGTSRRAWASEKGLRVCGMEGEPRRKFRLFFAAPLPLLSGPESVRDLCLRSCLSGNIDVSLMFWAKGGGLCLDSFEDSHLAWFMLACKLAGA